MLDRVFDPGYIWGSLIDLGDAVALRGTPIALVLTGSLIPGMIGTKLIRNPYLQYAVSVSGPLPDRCESFTSIATASDVVSTSTVEARPHS